MSTADEETSVDDDAGSRLTHYAGVVAGVVLSGCSTLTRADHPLNEDASGLDADQFSSESGAIPRSNVIPEPSPTPTDEPPSSPSPTETTPTDTPATSTETTPTDTPATSTETPTPAATEESPTATETARPADAGSGGAGGSAAAASGGGGGRGTAPTPTATPGTTTETATPTDTDTRALRTPVETVTAGGVSSPLTGTITVSDRETGYLCLLDADSRVSFSFAGETADGGAVNWYLCDPTTLESYWTGSMAGVFASFHDWPTFEFGPYTTGPGPTALVVEPVGDPVTLSYSIVI